jgi:endonuclease/exonuclease/phosphatase family metal-dependent hydrolase
MIPPANSKYASIDALSEIENKLQNFRKNNKYICLHGDFNSRASEESYFIDFDRELCNIRMLNMYLLI